MQRYKNKSIGDLEIEKHNLIDLYERDRFTINVMKETYKERGNTRKFLKKKKEF